MANLPLFINSVDEQTFIIENCLIVLFLHPFDITDQLLVIKSISQETKGTA